MAEQPNQEHHQEHSPYPRSHSEAEAAAGIVPSHGISINFPDAGPHSHIRPHPVKHMSAPVYQSPIRHHRRVPSKSKGVVETLNARSHYGSSDDDGASVHRINQYIVKQEIGRGSFGCVHLAEDQYGTEYAVKEFSKSRLRKRAQSNLLRKPNQQRRPGHLSAGVSFNSPLHRWSSSDKMRQHGEGNNSLSLIKEEIAIMKKLNHNNLVSLFEVLDDPQEDSLYMVLEYCKKGVVMKVGVDERAEPYSEEACRCWFRDMILGLEYLHHQGIVHRDIKPDNCLITDDDVLKIVDFGVSEMFEKDSDMATTKSAGSPAFMPPELCVVKHGQVSGRAADIWSMGVTLHCLRYGHIPFEKTGMLELYESIRSDELRLETEPNPEFENLMRGLLEKDPDKRITMDELREHPWVTKGGTDPLLSADENCADLVDPPTEAEMEHAITGNMAHLMVVMKAVKRFKNLLFRRRPHAAPSILGRDSNRLVSPPHAIRGSSKSTDAHDRKPFDKVLVTSGVHRDVDVDDHMQRLPRGMDQLTVRSPLEINIEAGPMQAMGETDAHYKQRMETKSHRPHASDPSIHHSQTFPMDEPGKGQAHDPLKDTLFLDIGASIDDVKSDGGAIQHIVSESPPAVEDNIYEQAYQDEMKRIMAQRGHSASMYLNRRVEHRDDLRNHASIADSRDAAKSLANKFQGLASRNKSAAGGLAGLVRQAQDKGRGAAQQESSSSGEDPPLQAPKLDGNEERVAGDAEEKSTTLRTQPATDAQLDDHQGAMPGMPGGFPVGADETASS